MSTETLILCVGVGNGYSLSSDLKVTPPRPIGHPSP